MKRFGLCVSLFVPAVLLISTALAQPSAEIPRRDWGAPAVHVSHAPGKWIIAGETNRVVLDELDLSVAVKAGAVTWKMGPSQEGELLVRWKSDQFGLRLADAGRIDITPYHTGYEAGVKIRLDRFAGTGMFTKGLEVDLAVILTVALEGKTEELVCTATAIERQASVRRLDWPKAFETGDVDYTLLPHMRGVLLPRDWPKPYYPFSNVPGSKGDATDSNSVIVANHVECWSMAWWGFVQGSSAMIVITETPDDASYQFSHPAGGPTVIGPRWLASLGRFRYPRSVRICFFDEGNYVTLAKRYRKYVKETGLFVSLKEKIARSPIVAELIGMPHVQQQALMAAKSFQAMPYFKDLDVAKKYQEDKGYSLTTFDECAGQLKQLKDAGIDRAFVTMFGWPYLGSNHLYPDPLPPTPLAGGWEGMRRWGEACKELGYLFALHDQYFDFYVNAPSYDPQFAIHEENSISRPTVFPGTRFKNWKEGNIPFMDEWAGGKQAYLNTRFALGRLRRNHSLLAEHGIVTDGIYFDVLGYAPPTEDFNPDHPMTRSDCMRYRAMLYNWARTNRGLVGTEAGVDWIVPYVDYARHVGDGKTGAGIRVPLYNLVYHDAIMTTANGLQDPLNCLLNGGFPWYTSVKDVAMVKTICALHKRVALLEMSDHVMLDRGFRKQRTTFSDGTTVTIDQDAGTYTIRPALPGNVRSSGRL